jgi:hypothetical protein
MGNGVQNQTHRTGVPAKPSPLDNPDGGESQSDRGSDSDTPERYTVANRDERTDLRDKLGRPCPEWQRPQQYARGYKACGLNKPPIPSDHPK